MSKIETGAQFPTDEDVTEWLAAANATHENAAVMDLLIRARVESVSFPQEYRKPGGTAFRQQSVRDLERQSTRIASFQPAMVPSLLQTTDFIRDLLSLPCGPATLGASENDIERMVSVRIERQNLLYDNEKILSFVLGEAALWTRVGSLDNHLGQLDRLQAVSGLRTIDLRIVPFTTVLSSVIGGFDLFDDRLVVVENVTGDHLLADPYEVKIYENLFKHLQASAVGGDEAVSLIKRVSQQLAQ